MIGTAGLLYLKWKSDRVPGDGTMMQMDVSFILILFLSAFSGMLLLVFRETAAMGTLLAIHLGIIAAFFLMIPYGKLAHVGLPLLGAGQERHRAAPRGSRRRTATATEAQRLTASACAGQASGLGALAEHGDPGLAGTVHVLAGQLAGQFGVAGFDGVDDLARARRSPRPRGRAWRTSCRPRRTAGPSRGSGA